MDTKLKSDIAESAVVTKLLKLGYRVLKPVGDRLPYDVAVDIDGNLIRIQVKSAWFHNGMYTIDTRRTKTNRRRMIRSRYEKHDFDFAIAYLADLDLMYVIPIENFLTFRSGIAFVEDPKRQRKPRSYLYREAWGLLHKRAAQLVTAE